jgi:PAS domain-containing protein
LALTVERDIQGRLGALQALALSRSAREGDAEGFRRAAEAMLAQQMPGANILLLREDGQQVMNTAVPPGQPLPARRGTTTLRRLFATGQPSVSDVYAGVVLRRPIVALEVPVFGPDKKVVLSLALNPTTDAFNEILRRQRLPEPWVLGLYDGRGAFVARSRDGERVAGQPAGPLLLPRLLSEREGLLDTVSRDGVPVLTAFSRIDSFGWTAAVSVPLAEIAAPAWRSALRTLASGMVSLLAGLSLALLVARRITGPIASLRDLAAAPDNDRPHAVATTGLADVDEVAEALVAGACARRAAAAALRESEFRLRLALDASQLGIWLWEAGGSGLSGDAR